MSGNIVGYGYGYGDGDGIYEYDDDGLMWGRDSWVVLHLTCQRFDNDKVNTDKASEFIETFRRLLLCLPCRQHFKMLLDNHPPPPPPYASSSSSSSQPNYFEWSVAAHNVVNARLGKPIFCEKKALQHYANLYQDPNLYGPPYWRYMHRLVAFSAKPDMEINPKDLENMLLIWIPQILPNAKYGERFGEILKTNFVNEHSQSWQSIISRIHNYYNMNLGKPAWTGNDQKMYSTVSCGAPNSNASSRSKHTSDTSNSPNKSSSSTFRDILPLVLVTEGLVILSVFLGFEMIKN